MKNFTIIALLLPSLLYAQEKSSETEVVNTRLFGAVHDTIASKIKRGAIPSFSIAVCKSGDIIWQESFGWADKAKKVAATPSTPYALASLSKSITSTALMILAEKGLINFNDTVNKYLGSARLTFFQGNSSQLTISHLTNMTGGIPHQWEYFYNDQAKRPLSIDKQIKRYGIVVFPPGEVFHYSNFSPAIAEQVIRNVTGKNISVFMKENVFDPLHMKNARVDRMYASRMAVAKGYDINGNLLAESEFYPRCGGGYYASVSDLIHYGMFHLKEKSDDIVLSDSSIDFLHSPTTYTGHNKFYANGWGVLKMPEAKSSLLSNGAIDGAASSLLLIPDSDIAIACLTNATVGNDFTDQVCFAVADVLLPGYMEELQKFFEENAGAFADKPFQPVDSLTGLWTGKIITYKDTIPVQLTIGNDGKISIRIQNQFETVLNNVVISDGLIQAQCYGELPLPETQDIPQYLEIILKPGKDELFGSINTQAFHTTRPFFLIPAYIQLKRTSL